MYSLEGYMCSLLRLPDITCRIGLQIKPFIYFSFCVTYLFLYTQRTKMAFPSQLSNEILINNMYYRLSSFCCNSCALIHRRIYISR